MYKGQGKGCGDTEERGGHVSQAVRSRCVLLAENQAGVPDTHACILASSSCIIGCPGPACPHTYRTGVSYDICPGLCSVQTPLTGESLPRALRRIPKNSTLTSKNTDNSIGK